MAAALPADVRDAVPQLRRREPLRVLTRLGCAFRVNAEWRLDTYRLVADQSAQQRGAELLGDFLCGAPALRPQPAVGAERHPDVTQCEHVRVAVVKLAAGDAAIDDVAHVLVDLGFLLADVGYLVLGEPFCDLGPLLEVHRRALDVAGDADQQPASEVVDGLARRRRRVVMQRVDREVRSALVDVVEDQRFAGVVVVDRRLVQADGVGHVVHPRAVIATRGQQLLATGHPVGTDFGHGDSLYAGPDAVRASINWLDSLGLRAVAAVPAGLDSAGMSRDAR